MHASSSAPDSAVEAIRLLNGKRQTRRYTNSMIHTETNPAKVEMEVIINNSCHWF